MENKRTFKLNHIKANDVLFVSGCSQCKSKATITITGLKESIVLKKENEDENLQHLKCEHYTSEVLGENLEVCFEIDNGSKMKVIQHAMIMTDKDGNEKGLNYIFNIEDIEDLENGDEDFNDYYLNIVVWHSKN